MKTPETLLSVGAQYDEAKFSFDPEEHKYLFDGKEMTGTTTVLKGIKNVDALLGWAAGQAVEHLIKNPGDHDGARKAHVMTRNKRMVEGVDTHALVEKYIKLMIADQDGRPLEMNDDPTHYWKPIEPFIGWARANEVRFIGSEVAVYYLDGFVGGIIDFLFEKDGKVIVGDLKTNKKPRYGSAIYYSYWMQLASYRNCIESLGGTVNGQCIVRMNTDFEVAWRDEYEADKQAFLGALAIYRGTRAYEQSYQLAIKPIDYV